MNNLIHRFLIRCAMYNRKILLYAFNFDKWHISPLISRKYAQDLITFLNRVKNNSFYLEIGCGLGDIIRNVNFNVRLGLDYEENVIRAARFLSLLSLQRNITYGKFTFPTDNIEGKFDAIVLVNWIHHITPEILRSKLTEYFQDNLNNNGIIIIDTVQNKAYKYNHNVNFLIENIQCDLIRIGEYENNREIWGIKKSNKCVVSQEL